ncbi:MAG TPA: hypothetical protein VFD00_12005 [Thermoclostridium sp.]|nr:hypothetical protein [Thermoclostridium sp.]
MVKMKKVFLAIGMTVSLSGCISMMDLPSESSTKHVRSFPEENLKTSASIGSEILFWEEYQLQKFATLEGELPTKIWKNKHKSQANAKLIELGFKGGKIYCNDDRYNPFCLSDSNGDGNFDIVHIIGMSGLTNGSKISLVPYKIKTEAVKDSKGFRYELVYSGVSGDVVRVMYREYKDDMARPAFTQELTYTLQEKSSTKIKFKSAEIDIHSAGNNQIDYTVIKGFKY